MSGTHPYLSTACFHEERDGDPGLHGACRQTCKFCDAPCSCRSHGAHAAGAPASWVDQARGVARDLLDTAVRSGASLPPGFLRRLNEDPALFWLRGEEQPPGDWHA